MFTPPDTSVETRLAALEMQRSTDHGYLVEVRQDFIDVGRALKQHTAKHQQAQSAHAEHTQMGLQLRREIYEIQGKLAAEIKRV